MSDMVDDGKRDLFPVDLDLKLLGECLDHVLVDAVELAGLGVLVEPRAGLREADAQHALLAAFRQHRVFAHAGLQYLRERRVRHHGGADRARCGEQRCLPEEVALAVVHHVAHVTLPWDIELSPYAPKRSVGKGAARSSVGAHWTDLPRRAHAKRTRPLPRGQMRARLRQIFDVVPCAFSHPTSHVLAPRALIGHSVSTRP